MENTELTIDHQLQLPHELQLNEAQYQCDFCSRSFKRRDRLLVHLKVHTGDRPYICGVPGCRSSYTRLQHLQRHIERVHFAHGPPDAKLECPHCDTLLANAECLKRHEQRFHSESPQGKVFECPEEGCSDVFRKKYMLISHREQVHGSTNADRCHKCPVEGCDKSFSFPTVLRRHMKVHRGYTCDVDGCGNDFETYFQLRKHKADEHGPDLICAKCQTRFKSRQTLVQHLKTHLVVKELFMCTEEGCDRTFLYKKNLKQHVRAYHQGEKVFIKKKIPKEERPKKIPRPNTGARKSSAAHLCGVDNRGGKANLETPLDLSSQDHNEQEQDQNPGVHSEDILHTVYPPYERLGSSSDTDCEPDPLQAVQSIIDETVKSIFVGKDSSSNASVKAEEGTATLAECEPEKIVQINDGFSGCIGEKKLPVKDNLSNCLPTPLGLEKNEFSEIVPIKLEQD